MNWDDATTLGQVSTIVMGQSPESSTYNEIGQGLPFFQGVKDFGVRYPDQRVYCTAPTKIAERGDILLSVRAPIGSINRANQKCAIGRGLSAIRANRESDSDFIEFLLRSMHKSWSAYESQGTVFGNLRKQDLEDLKIIWPPDGDLRIRIASILLTYENLIENNERRIALLEKAACQLYKEWFVRFRFPGYEHVKINNGVPEGWSEGVIADFYQTSSGGTPSRKRPEYYTGDTIWVKTQELKNSYIFETDEKITDEAVLNSSAKLFPKYTVLVAMYGATIGQAGILAKPGCSNQACCAIVPKVNGANYIHAFLFILENKFGLVNLGQGSAQNNISQMIIKNYPMIFPSFELMNKFIESLLPVFQQIENLATQIMQLEKARDLLLPKLMSGEIAV